LAPNTKLLLESVLLPDGWAKDVIVEIRSSGDFGSIEIAQPDSRPDVQRIPGCVVPGMPNCHSHAHQRAMAGLGERAGWDIENDRKAIDSFWTWRVAMYHYLERVQPRHLYAISRQLYLEMLKSGYTNVAEFQYLHHDPNGNAYANRAEMTLQCMQAARNVGIGFTALPVLYRYGGFGRQDPLDGQKRFLNDSEQFCEIVNELHSAVLQFEENNFAVGIAPHSLRAVSEQLLNEVIDSFPAEQLAAIHVHVAEQTREVDECLQWCGEPPVQWLLNRFDLNLQWCLIHATHMNDRETSAFAKSGAVAGICPTTEANLGDGFFNLVDFVSQGGIWAIGSDSHISISPVEELRWLEYGQRLLHRQRNIVAEKQNLNTGMALYSGALAGGSQSSGRNVGKIETGARADFIVLDSEHPRQYARKESNQIDSWVFSGNENPIQDVYVGGVRVISDGHHIDEEKIENDFKKAIDGLSA
jgi:formimidoylglutamate deiminase